MRIRPAAFAAAAAASAAALISTATPAVAAGNLWSADQSWVGERASICADDVGVRNAPEGGAFAHLYKYQTIQIDQVSTEWVHGFAYGDVNANGWIQNGWFCP